MDNRTSISANSTTGSPPDCLVSDGEDPASTFQMSTLGYVIAEIGLMAFLSFGNILVLVAVWQFGELRTSTNTFVLSLTISDLMVALIALPLHIAIFLFPAAKTVFMVCMMRYCIVVVSSGTSILTLMLISVDRYIAIENPYAYQRLMSKARSKIFCAIVWAYALSYGALPLLGWNQWTNCVDCTFSLVLTAPYIAFILGHIFVIVGVIGILNMKIFLTANAISRDIQNQVSAISGGESAKQNLFLKNRKAAMALAMVFGAYAICNLPFAIFMIWEVCVLNISPDITSVPPWFNTGRIVTTFISFINSGINPIIYHRRIPEFRKAFRKLLKLKSEIQDASA